ncbi:tetratricopeptide repeat protein 38 [Streptomyces rimosus subsp. rimosus]|nr:tetratricopeptide repeat protein 38 [Kitasatospora aureofaciens]KOT28584.1 tetratricopeptide repeat protein 38 [Streptomyces rimosus subsp. rimosus]KOT29383.1 tetratricopeptide repeat protein 38 [Streptomyces sp. NRRL WC-3701]KOT48142.1 tetratricopeptide repeat protein 38 [Streptomyces rimosus subsp. rimosus]KOT48793.1 tetratricopeptide repeat protein 38 [Streptomyces rimosus subsp. rimosus]
MMMPRTVSDRHGHAMSRTGADAASHYEDAMSALLFFRGEVADASQALLAAAPESVMGNVLAAYLGLLGTEEKDATAAREAFTRFTDGVHTEELTPRERMHLAAATSWLDGDIHRAGRILGELTVAHPRDELALATGHQIDFLTGDAVRLRDRVGGALTAWPEDDPHYGHLLGMYAFGLEESGHYDRAREAGLAAVGHNPRDVWGIHAVVHTYEMQGRFAEGIRFLDARTDDWGSGNYLNVHNWWHYCLYALEAGDTARALGIYDAVLHHDASAGLAMELLDASALLWRLLLADRATGDRWPRLADAWAARQDPPYYAFNDVHAVMAYVGADRIADAERLVADRTAWLGRTPPELSNHAMTAEIGLPVCRALIAYGQGRYGDVVDLLAPIRYRLNTYGGSHAQRDAVQKTLLEAALCAGRDETARTLLSERINLRPVCPYNWLAQARLADRLGETAKAAAARTRAAEQAAQGAAALSRP